MSNEMVRRAYKPYRRYLIGLVVVVLVLVLFRVALAKGREREALLKGGGDNLYVSLIWWQYALEHDGILPALDRTPGRLTFDRTGTHPAYRIGGEYGKDIDDPNVALLMGTLNKRPGYTLEPRVDDSRQFYLGYAMTNEAEGQAFVTAYQRALREGTTFTADLPVPEGQGTFRGDVLYRLNFDLPTRLAPLAQADGIPALSPGHFPVMIERPGHYPVSGGWVVYLNRQMRFLPYPGPWPMTESFIGALTDLVDVKQDKNGDAP